jgi:energy-coupling factor transport system permease protein
VVFVIATYFILVTLAVAYGWYQAWRRNPSLFHWTTRDIVIGSGLAVAVGMLFVAWAWVTQVLRIIPEPFNDWAVGFWMIGGTLVAYVVRRPGAAFMGEMVAALVEAPLVPWGITTLISGLVQGLPAEAAFALTKYRNWGLGVLMAAGALAAVGGFLQEYYPYGMSERLLWVQLASLGLRIVGGAVLGGWLAKVTGDALVETGTLDGMPVAERKTATTPTA